MKRSIPSLILIASLMLSVSCGNAAPPADNHTSQTSAVAPTTPEKLSGSHWRAVSINGTSVILFSKVTLDFNDDGTFRGHAGVNSYGGNYTVNGTGVRFSYIVITLLLGPFKPVNQQEDTYIECLEGAASYRVKGARLEIFDAAGRQLLAFRRTS